MCHRARVRLGGMSEELGGQVSCHRSPGKRTNGDSTRVWSWGDVGK